MKIIRLVIAAAMVLLLSAGICSAGQSQIVDGNARFTVITPNLIRMEYADGAAFTDAATLFAVDRTSRYYGATIEQQGERVLIDTGVISLSYVPDGKPFSAANLSAKIRRGGEWVEWKAGLMDEQNLGGTVRTLDGVHGPIDLGEGLLSRNGWAVVDDSATPVLTADWVRSRPNRGGVDWYLFGYGLDFHAALRSLDAVSGPVPLPRKNLLGIWYSRYWPYTSAEFRQIVQQYGERGFPLDNIVMDMDWHITQVSNAKQGYLGQVWTGYTWDRKLLPDAEELLKWFHEQGLSVTLNDHPADGVQPHEQMYAAFMNAMGADPASGETLPFDAGDKKYLDTFFQYTHEPLEKEGVDFWWLDWQQYPYTRSIKDLTNLAWLNHYNFVHTSSDGKRGVSFSRWAGWGDHRDPIHFSGDANTGWPMLAFEVPFTSTAGNVGCFFWTHDIGGHMGGRNEESYTRWCQFGAMSAALRSHSTRDATMDRRPWTYPKWAEDSMRVSFGLRSQLMPYIYSSAAESSHQMVPLLRPMYFEHPDQESAYHNAQEYFLGDQLLVAPITTPGVGPSRLAWQMVWFPAGSGRWYDFFSGERHNGGSEAIVADDIDAFPLFVHGGVPLPMQPYTPRPTSAALNHLIVRCYPGEENQTGTTELYEDDGQTQAYMAGAKATTDLSYSRNGDQSTITIGAAKGHYDGQVASRSYTIELPCVEMPTRVMVDGVDSPVVYDAATSTARVEIASRPIDAAVSVVVDAGLVSDVTIHQRALAAKLAGIVGRPVVGDSDKQLVDGAIGAVGDPSLRGAILAAAGAAVVRRNDSPYLYHGLETFRVYVEPGILDSDAVTASLVSGSVAGKVTPETAVNLAVAPVIDVKSLGEGLPEEDSVVVPGKESVLRIAARVAGQECDMTTAAGQVAPTELDLARSATATASSSEDGYSPGGAIDGVADGYPNDKQHEWSSNHQTEGATLTLTWKNDQTISRVALYDRPNDVDQVLGGQVVFSDGSTVPFGELPNDGKTPAIIKFGSKQVRWLRVEVTKVKPGTKNAGLGEIAAFK
jgi:alpha-glucosidase (family GH31 glycosyl hydrolase)